MTVVGRQDIDYHTRVALGMVPGHSLVVMRGHNPSQTAISGFVDVSEFGDLTYLTTAETMEITSTGASAANDTLLGSGARTVRISGVGNDGSEVSQIIDMDGTNDVTTDDAYLRVNLLEVLTVGATGWNEAVITATATTAGTVQSQIDTGDSEAHSSFYTVPLDHILLIYQIELNVVRLAGGQAPLVEFQARERRGGDGNAWRLFFDKRIDAAASSELDISYPFPSETAIARTDIRMRTDTDQDDTETRTRVYAVLVHEAEH